MSVLNKDPPVLRGRNHISKQNTNEKTIEITDPKEDTYYE